MFSRDPFQLAVAAILASLKDIAERTLGDIGQHDEHVRFSEAAPHLKEAVGILQDAGRRVSLSWFPECMLGERASALHHHRATLLIHDEFSERAAATSTFSCPHQDTCSRFNKTCLGLHERYIEVFGDEADSLVPALTPS